MKIDRHIHPLAPSAMLPKDLHPYVHGAGFGIATEILADATLADLLRTLEPRRFEVCDQILNQENRVLNANSAKKITLAMENSPVVAALAQVKCGQVPLEWDIWLDPEEPWSLNKARIEHGSVFATLLGKFSFLRNYFLKSAPSVSSWVETYSQARRSFSHIEKLPPLCLDIKSAWSTARDIDLFVQNLKETLQIDVCYVGSFSYRQIAEIKGAEKILFCHAVWDLKKNVESGHFPKSIMLNGADLEEETNLDELRKIAKEHQLKIGVYVQEPEAGTAAVQRLIEMVNKEPELFSLGFALGNSRDGRAARMIEGSGAGVQKTVLTNGVVTKMKRVIERISQLHRSWVKNRFLVTLAFSQNFDFHLRALPTGNGA